VILIRLFLLARKDQIMARGGSILQSKHRNVNLLPGAHMGHC
jgi:hypothetical protein